MLRVKIVTYCFRSMQVQADAEASYEIQTEGEGDYEFTAAAEGDAATANGDVSGTLTKFLLKMICNDFLVVKVNCWSCVFNIIKSI